MATEITHSLTETRFKISNMVCEGCAEKITTILKAWPGVKEIKSKVFQKQIQVNYNSKLIGQEDIKKVLKNEGYHPVEI